MTPEERRAAAREKILKRAQLNDHELASAIINGNLSEVANQAKSPEVELQKVNNFIEEREANKQEDLKKKQEAVDYLKAKRRKIKIEKIRTLFFLFMGTATAVFALKDEFNSKSNLFLLFIFLDVA